MKNLTEHLKHGAEQAWQSLADGWREISSRASGALTRFKPTQPARGDSSREAQWPSFSGWALMAADVSDDDDKVTVRIEMPGLRREDFDIQLQGDVLTVSGEKRVDRELLDGQYRSMQCAYGSFTRQVVMPVPVKAANTKATYRDGVLRIELPKAEGARVRRIAIKAA